ncbi:hypothetical protein QE152_g10039 [Popillia japonica]|uniref:DUF8207 domain-containing protein n=1 Tax=Popillia japonica TaxID=7064 RepID=A0AAW1LVX3_POPJA
MFDDKEKDRRLQTFDYKYGIRYEQGKFYIGNSPIDIYPNGDIEIKNKIYTGTKGLYELLFKKDPTSYTEDDEKNYKKIALKTNLILR